MTTFQSIKHLPPLVGAFFYLYPLPPQEAPMGTFTAANMIIPAPGEEATVPLTKDQQHLVIRHGSSLSLVASVCEFLANPDQDDSFNYIDPTSDYNKWQRKGMDLYYAAVVGSSSGSILCALRTATQGLGTDDEKQKKRLLIDYVYTAPFARDKGVAGRLVASVLAMAKRAGAYAYVLSLEESAVYWMEKWGFFLCEDPNLNAKLNVFPDTHLLRRRSDPQDDEEDAENSSPNNKASEHASNDTSSTALPETFDVALAQLLARDPTLPRSDQMKLWLASLALLIKNAVSEEPGGRHRRIKIANPAVKARIFAVGGEAAMKLLDVCGFELGVEEEGNVTLTFHGDGAAWLTEAIERLAAEADGSKGGNDNNI